MIYLYKDSLWVCWPGNATNSYTPFYTMISFNILQFMSTWVYWIFIGTGAIVHNSLLINMTKWLQSLGHRYLSGSAETTGYIVCSECSNSKEIGCIGHVSIVLVSLHKVRQRGVHCLFHSTPGLGTFWGISGKNPGPYELHPGPFWLLLRPSGHYMGAN